ncbi:Upstream stimulatory factor 2 [Blomia tropicalis]|nr:Upstream stimulatory factor 2 [Blomia tropicalis]
MDTNHTRRRTSITKRTALVIVIEDNSLLNKDQNQISTNTKPTISYRLVPLSSTTANNSSITQASGSTSPGQVLIMMPNNREVLTDSMEDWNQVEHTGKTVIDQKRRLMHKEIERRRRDKINDWIFELSKQVPDCASDRTKQGQSKGGILAKTAKYIEELRHENEKINIVRKENENLTKELERLRQQFINVEAENKRLQSLLKDHDIPF